MKLPAALGRSWEPHAYAFYALEAMGELDKVHDALFDALAGERRPLNTPEALADFVAGYGVNAEKFLENYNVSHALNHTRRRFLPNLQNHRFWVESVKRFVKLRVSTKGMRIIDKKGIDAVLADLRARGEKV